MTFCYISCTHFKVIRVSANNFTVIVESAVSLLHPVCDTRVRFRPQPTGSIAVAVGWREWEGVLDEKWLISISHNFPHFLGPAPSCCAEVWNVYLYSKNDACMVYTFGSLYSFSEHNLPASYSVTTYFTDIIFNWYPSVKTVLFLYRVSRALRFSRFTTTVPVYAFEVRPKQCMSPTARPTFPVNQVTGQDKRKVVCQYLRFKFSFESDWF